MPFHYSKILRIFPNYSGPRLKGYDTSLINGTKMKLRSLIYWLLCLFFVACGNKRSHPVVRTFTGNGKMGMGDGERNVASFANPMGIAADNHGDLYVADSYNNLIRKINSEGTVTTFAGSGEVGSADGKGRAASFFFP